MRKIVGLTALGLCMAVSGVLGASLQLQSQWIFTLPWAVDTERGIELADATGDRFPEIAIATDSQHVAVYSLTGDSLLFLLTLPDSDLVITQRFADINGDSLADLLTLTTRTGPNWPAGTCYIRLYDAASGFTNVATDSLAAGNVSQLVSPSFDGHIELADLDGDGFPNVVVSCDTGVYANGLGDVNISSLTRAYTEFPGTIAWDRPYHLSWLNTISGPPGGNLFLGGYHYEYAYFFHIFSTSIFTTSIRRVLSDGSLSSYDKPSWYEWDCPQSNNTDVIASEWPACFGRIDSTRSGETLLLSYYWRESCGEYYPHETDSSGSGYALFEVIDADSLERIWIKSDSGEIKAALYDTAFPGYSLAIRDNLLSLFRGEDGAIMAQTASLEPGLYSWTENTPDGRPRLVRRDQEVLTFYRLDISTDVDDQPQGSLPTSFALGVPYPNPFNGSIILPISNDHRQHVRIDIVNTLGQKLATVYDDELAAGEKRITWDAGNRPSGVYFVRATTDAGGDSKKVIYLK